MDEDKQDRGKAGGPEDTADTADAVGNPTNPAAPSDPIEGASEERAPRRFRLRAAPSELITSARRSAYEDRRRRTKWYLILQFSRLPTSLLAGVAYFWWDSLFLTVLFFVLAVPAPAVAVVFANERGERKDPRTRNIYKPGVARQLAREQLSDPGRAALEGPADGNLPAIIEHENRPPDPSPGDGSEER